MCSFTPLSVVGSSLSTANEVLICDSMEWSTPSESNLDFCYETASCIPISPNDPLMESVTAYETNSGIANCNIDAKFITKSQSSNSMCKNLPIDFDLEESRIPSAVLTKLKNEEDLLPGDITKLLFVLYEQTIEYT